MNQRDKLRHAPRARVAYEHFVYEHQRAHRLDTACALLAIGAAIGFVALPFILFYLEWLP
jgi:hypothetical protein